MLEPPDLSKFGRSEQLHVALFGVYDFVRQFKRYPENNEEDIKTAIKLAKEKMAANVAESDSNLKVEELDEKVLTLSI
jgi:predicted RecB family endonuclease